MKTHLAHPPCAWCLDDFEAHQHLRPGYDCARCECRRYIAPGFGSLVWAEARSWVNAAAAWLAGRAHAIWNGLATTAAAVESLIRSIERGRK